MLEFHSSMDIEKKREIPQAAKRRVVMATENFRVFLIICSL